MRRVLIYLSRTAGESLPRGLDPGVTERSDAGDGDQVTMLHPDPALSAGLSHFLGEA